MGGGLEIASVCDLRIAGRSAQFGVPVHLLGFPLAPAEMQWLFRLVGHAVSAAHGNVAASRAVSPAGAFVSEVAGTVAISHA